MNNDIILKAIEDGNERGFLDKLRNYPIDDFNNQLKNLLKILLVLIEKSKDHISPQQYFYKVIVKILPQIVSEKALEKEFVSIIKENSIPNYVYTSQIIRQLIIAIIDHEIDVSKYREGLVTFEDIKSFKHELISINVSFLEIAIYNGFNHDDITWLFYNSVINLERERKIILAPEAIEVFRKYLLKDPEDYLKGFIRPLYSGGINKNFPEYFLHVAEPFHAQIFDDNDFSITDFFKNAKGLGIDENLVNDVESFYFKVIDKKSIDGNKSLLLSDNGSYEGLVLKSTGHRNIRPELTN
ncbi:MAG: hypothetical protein EOO90_20105 [Pedobacter sp.]|nr:MAG: hypothetical protein EOO90_20105 [Pedobacter sp.]